MPMRGAGAATAAASSGEMKVGRRIGGERRMDNGVICTPPALTGGKPQGLCTGSGGSYSSCCGGSGKRVSLSSATRYSPLGGGRVKDVGDRGVAYSCCCDDEGEVNSGGSVRPNAPAAPPPPAPRDQDDDDDEGVGGARRDGDAGVVPGSMPSARCIATNTCAPRGGGI
jgi:hypothetical protein